MNSRNNWLIVLLLGAVAAYFTPWIVNPGISLSMGAYDLAEWISLTLPERPLTIMLLLRILPACLAVLVALWLGRTHPKVAIEWVIVTAVALLPPFEFLRQRDDINYQQQFFLAVGTFVVGCLCLTTLIDPFRRYLIPLVGVATIGINIAGLIEAARIMEGLRLPAGLGFGGVAFVLLIGLFAAAQLIDRSTTG